MMLFASIAISAFILLVGLTALVRDIRRLENRLFFVVTLSSAIWALNFYLIDKYSELWQVKLANAASYSLGALTLLSVLVFTYNFPKKKDKKSLYISSIVFLVLAMISPTPLVNGTVERVGNTYVFNEGPLAILYSLVLFGGVIQIFYSLLYKRRGYTTSELAQSNMLARGFVLSFALGIIFSTVVPIFAPESDLVDLAPFSILAIVGYSVFAMSKHKLFDFRTVIVRAVSYLVATASVAVIYVSSLFLARRLLFPETSVTTGQLLSNVAIGLVLVITYPRIKKSFDKITNVLFFQDRYDPQLLIDSLNQLLVSTIDLDMLLRKTSNLLVGNIKTDSAAFFISKTSYSNSRIIGESINHSSVEDLSKIQDLLTQTHTKVYEADKEPNSEQERILQKLFKKNDIEIVARLISTLDNEVKEIGFLFLGPKKSGAQYTQQDIKFLEIIANEFVIAIENILRFEEIEQFNVTLQKKIDDATKQLQRTNQKLLELDEAKDEFVSMASHQLRTPLTSIKGYISMVMDGDAGKTNPTQNQMLGQAMFSAQRMVYLISDLLNVSRLKTGKFVIESKPVFLPDIISSELQQLKEGFESKEISLTFDKPETFSVIELDEMKIRQVVMNFVDNALYYTPRGGSITVQLKETKDAIDFTVRDTGIGVPKDEQHKLFTKFYRAGNARKARPDGTGLGLFMAKKVVMAQGGSIIFESKEGKGSTFGFTFSKKKLMEA